MERATILYDMPYHVFVIFITCSSLYLPPTLNQIGGPRALNPLKDSGLVIYLPEEVPMEAVSFCP